MLVKMQKGDVEMLRGSEMGHESVMLRIAPFTDFVGVESVLSWSFE